MLLLQQQVGGGMGALGHGGWLGRAAPPAAPQGLLPMRPYPPSAQPPPMPPQRVPRYGYGGVLQRSPPAAPSPRPQNANELLLLRQSPAPQPPHPPHPQDDNLPPLTPQDQLSKFVEQL